MPDQPPAASAPTRTVPQSVPDVSAAFELENVQDLFGFQTNALRLLSEVKLLRNGKPAAVPENVGVAEGRLRSAA